VPVGGVSESVIVGNVEIQMQLNEDGSLTAQVFNRENNINYIGEGIGYTQGLGLTYNVEFNTFKEMIRKIFTNKKAAKTATNSSSDVPDSADIPSEFLDYINNRKEKKLESPKEIKRPDATRDS
jgi:hypothetical protein